MFVTFPPSGCCDHGPGFAMGQPVWLCQMQSGWKGQPEKHGKGLFQRRDPEAGM